MKPITKILNERDKILFEKALKFYFFTRQQDINKLNSELHERFRYAGSVAWSLIITYIKEDQLKIEYMDFLNDELRTLRGIEPKELSPLMIQPAEIDEIAFSDRMKIKVYDMDEEKDLAIKYDPEKNTVIAEYLA
jgi:hypothetical protein